MHYQYIMLLFKSIGISVYLFRVLLCTALMLLVYYLLLRNKVAHMFNRYFLLACAVLPFVLPLVQLPVLSHAVSTPDKITAIVLPDVFVHANGVPGAWGKTYFYFAIIALVPLISLFLLVRKYGQYYRLKRLLQRRPFEEIKGIKLYRSAGIGPGSWQQNIFFPGTKIDEAVFLHEQAHVRLGHSTDLLVLQLLQCIFWPNILLWFVLRELRIVHEFQADEAAAGATGNDHYTAIILNETFHTTQFSLSHQFFQHPLKRRITMLYKTTSRRTRLLTILSAVIVTTCFLGPVVWAQNAQKKSSSGKSADAVAGEGGGILNKAEQMPEFPGGMDSLKSYLISNIHYPDSARKNNIQGRVITRFVVGKDGKISHVQVVKGASPLLDAEALRVVNTMPVWKPAIQKGEPVSVYFTLPVSFRLQD